MELSLTMEERQSNQRQELKEILTSFYSLFGQALLGAIKTIRQERMTDEENIQLSDLADKAELIARVAGLEKVFGVVFYETTKAITGQELIPLAEKAPPPNEQLLQEETPEEESIVSREPTRAPKLPKGFNKWDLKMIKLHESHPVEGKKIWVEFWSLKGTSYVGEILYNPTKQLFYFRPYDTSNPSFALTEEQARKATHHARNYYFRVAPISPEET